WFQEVDGTFAYDPPAGTLLGVGANQTLTVTFTPTDLVHYAPVTATAYITVYRAPLTITANNATKAYGAANPTLTVSYSGFVNGDTAASLTTPPSVTTTATATSGVGTYPITAGQAVSPDYTIGYGSGTLTISRAPLTITANNATKLLGAPNPPFTATYSG